MFLLPLAGTSIALILYDVIVTIIYNEWWSFMVTFKLLQRFKVNNCI